MSTRALVIVVVASVAGAFVLGFGTGRGTAPTKTVEVSKERHEEKAREHEETKATTATSAQAQEERIRTVVVRKWAPTGSLIFERREGTRTENQQASQAASVRVEFRDVEKQVIKTVEVTKIVEGPRPHWSMTAVGGVTYMSERLYGGALGYRFLGPVEAGAMVTNQGAALLLTVRW